jgi:Protein of unknown function (DUF4238)
LVTRQHILPRFLLKGFASRTNAKEIYTWVYQKPKNVFETNIKNVCSERQFYDEEAGLCVDTKITGQEGKFAFLLDEIRNSEVIVESEVPMIAAFIAHLALRTKHLRDCFRESSELLMNELFRHFFDYDNVKKSILGNPQAMKATLERELSSIPIAQRQKDLLQIYVIRMLPSVLDVLKPQLLSRIHDLAALVKVSSPKMVKHAHLRALSKDLSPEPRAEDYRKLHWSVHRAQEPLILGDVGCIFEISCSKKPFKSLNEKRDDLSAVFLPISHDQMLVGSALKVSPPIGKIGKIGDVHKNIN